MSYSGWSIRYATNSPDPDWPLLVARALRRALPEADVVVEPDAGGIALAVGAPGGTPAEAVAMVRRDVAEAVQRLRRATM